MPNSGEQRQVLDMLAEGKITAEEAQRLLEKLNRSTELPRDRSGETPWVSAPVQTGDRPPSGSAMPKYFRVLVNSADGDEVNIRIPLGLVRAGLKLSTVLPNDARTKLEQQGVDLSKLSDLEGEDLIEALRELSIDVDSSDGDVVRMFCE